MTASQYRNGPHGPYRPGDDGYRNDGSKTAIRIVVVGLVFFGAVLMYLSGQ